MAPRAMVDARVMVVKVHGGGEAKVAGMAGAAVTAGVATAGMVDGMAGAADGALAGAMVVGTVGARVEAMENGDQQKAGRA